MSSNEYCVTVDNIGTITGNMPGTAVVTASIPYTGSSTSITVKVTSTSDNSIVLSENSLLDIDSEGYIRRIPAGANTVSEIKEQFDNVVLSFYDENGNQLDDTDRVGTHTVVKYFDETGTLLDSATVVMTGDFNCDGLVDNKDVSAISRYLVNKEAPDGVQLAAIDVNGDGNVNNRDASILSRYLVGKEVI